MPVVPRTNMEVPMRSRVSKYWAERRYNDYRQASGLLRHDLVWSNDFDAIRVPLADLIDYYADVGDHPLALTAIVRNLIATENDLSI